MTKGSDMDFGAALVELKAGSRVTRAGWNGLAHHLDHVLPPGREKSLAMTHLEDVMMWANAAIARSKTDG